MSGVDAVIIFPTAKATGVRLVINHSYWWSELISLTPTTLTDVVCPLALTSAHRFHLFQARAKDKALEKRLGIVIQSPEIAPLQDVPRRRIPITVCQIIDQSNLG